ncbi:MULTISPECIES: hypothetical protein [unclassified Mesorhizobium]|uniref:hypothetical protein n=1 Tax=unclassified Mesorhizobium TaxID=325217 RepID=UPI000FDA979B|nr:MULTISPECIES: hypothetical protein [unclassified Mesorhizobium]TGT64042.1 hypothetical protein EN809_034870 [Mesorhizobium sp. M2E.F.Ca.ET.166.01.1.1]TGV97074.1 hypothetical protein EN797_035290 [Mesorhizobium sp. M2E.F.Ca.ET.154.01.1.1]
MSLPSYVRPTEAKIIKRLVRKALNLGYVVSVYDGEDYAIVRSNDFDAITAEIAATDSTELVFRRADDKTKIGSVLLIHGNDEDVISDHSDNELTNALVEMEDA